jgi:hypothetical protein
VGGVCSTHGRKEKSVQGFGGESPKAGNHLKNGDIDGRMGLEWIYGSLAGEGGGVDSPGSG